MSRHTPPPWHVKPSSYDGVAATIEAGLVTVATVETSLEDAHLMAIAPEIREALREFCHLTDGFRRWPGSPHEGPIGALNRHARALLARTEVAE